MAGGLLFVRAEAVEELEALGGASLTGRREGLPPAQAPIGLLTGASVGDGPPLGDEMDRDSCSDGGCAGVATAGDPSVQCIGERLKLLDSTLGQSCGLSSLGGVVVLFIIVGV